MPPGEITNLTSEQVKEHTVSGQMPMMYFNYARVASSFFDMRIFFGSGNITPKSEHTFQEELCVAISLEFARQLRDNISSQLEAYEKNFGKLRSVPTRTETTIDKPNGTKRKERGKQSTP
jgi:hypothetical protein